MNQLSEVVSFDDENLILVDSDDNVLGYRDKASCHDGEGVLHRAFSIFIFNDRNELLLQQRSAEKRLWPLFWSNSCCSHPRQGETMEIATRRRLLEELALEASLTYLFKFEYQARFEDKGSENELCSVYIGRSNDAATVNEHEIAAWKFVPFDEITRELAENPTAYTPWFKMEWERLSGEFRGQIEAL